MVRVAVILPVLGDLGRVWSCLESLAAQGDDPELELVLVDGGAPGLDALLRRLAGDVAFVAAQGRRTVADCVNAAVDRTSAAVVVILHPPPRCEPGLLAALVAALGRDGVAAATAATESGGHPAETAAVAVRRADLVRVGGVPDVADRSALAALLVALTAQGQIVAAGGPRALVAAPSPRPPRHALEDGPEVSIVVPTLAAASERVGACLRAIAATTSEPHEVIVVDNGSSPQGYTRPVNAGLRASSGSYLVVMNDDVEPLPGWWPPLRAALDSGAEVVFPTTVEGAMRDDFAAWCFAFARPTLARFGVSADAFLDPRFTVWFQDTDLLVRLRDAGVPPVQVRESTIRHALSQTVNTADPELSAWIRAQVDIDQQRFAAKHPQVGLARRGGAARW